MGLGISIDIQDQARPMLARFRRQMDRDRIGRAMGGGVARELRQHFRKLDQTKANRLSTRRTHFYAQAVKAVRDPKTVTGGVAIEIPHVGIAQRYFGGAIEQKPGGPLLTVPVHPEAYGRRAREFDDLVFVPAQSRAARAFLMRPVEGREFGEVYYRLARRVVQKGDKEVLPDDATLARAALAAGEKHAETIIAREARGP